MFRLLTGTLLSLLVSSAAAAVAEYLPCTVEGQAVQYLIVPPTSPLLSPGQQFAVASYMDEKRYQKYGYRGHVTIVSLYVKLLPNVLRQHIYAHECAHHLLGHSKRSLTYNSIKYIEEEQQADCYANKLLAEQGFTREQFDQLLAEMAKYQTISRANELKQCSVY